MKLESYLKNFNLDKARYIEENNDMQYIALNNAWKKISNKYGNYDENKELFLYLIIQNALIAFQLSGRGEAWWQEFCGFLVKDFNKLKKKKNFEKRWYNKLIYSKNNTRINSVKMKRIRKIENIRHIIDIDKLVYFYNNMGEFSSFLAKTMNQKSNAKTIVFTVKMFGYASRIVFDEFIKYPFSLDIPIDSRLRRIYLLEKNKTKVQNNEITEFFNNISKNTNIPLLHLDSILWIDYWYGS